MTAVGLFERKIFRPRPGRAVYRPLAVGLCQAVGAPGVEFRVEARMPCPGIVNGLWVPRAVGRHYQVVAIRIGADMIWLGPAPGDHFGEHRERPPWMLAASRGTLLSVSAVKVGEARVPLVATFVGVERVARRRPRRVS